MSVKNAIKYKFAVADRFLRVRISLVRLRFRMRSARAIVGEAPAVVSLTSHGNRIRHVHYTIQSIADGLVAPRKIILWISPSDAHLVTRSLRTLQRRGLEILFTENFGPHTKYHPYCAADTSIRSDNVPLVTADDDILYPSRWLADLIDVAALEQTPLIIAHRAHKMKLDNGEISPYLSWEWEGGTPEPSYTNVATGVGGVLYPVEFVSKMAALSDTQFMEVARSADDLWLHSRSVLLGIRTRQVRKCPLKILEHHPDLRQSLSQLNVINRANDEVVSRIYTSDIMATIHSAHDSNEKAPNERTT